MTLIPNPWVWKCCYARLPSSWRAFNKVWNLTAGFGCPELRLDTKGDRIRAPRLWTEHPEEIRLKVSVTSLKTHINWLLCQVTLFRLIFCLLFFFFHLLSSSSVCFLFFSFVFSSFSYCPLFLFFGLLLINLLLYLILFTVLSCIYLFLIPLIWCRISITLLLCSFFYLFICMGFCPWFYLF